MSVRMIDVLFILTLTQVSAISTCSNNANIQITCAANNGGCTNSCPPGFGPDITNPTCNYDFGSGGSPNVIAVPQCTVASPKFSLSCSTLTPTTDVAITCMVTIIPQAGGQVITGITTFQTKVVSAVSGPIILDEATGNAAGVVTISSSTGIGSFTVSSTVVRNDVFIFVQSQGGILPSSSVNPKWTAGVAASIQLVSWTPTTYGAGDVVGLVFSALDKYSNVVLGATGKLLSVSAEPCTYYNSTNCPTLALNNSPISFKSGQTPEFKDGSGSVAFTTTLSTASVKVSIAAGSSKLDSNPTIKGSWIFTFANAVPSRVNLTLSKTTATQGNTVAINLTLYDGYNNVAVNNNNWRFALKLQGGSAQSSMYGTMNNGVIQWNVTWNYVDTLYLTVLDPDGNGVTLPAVATIVFGTNLDVTLIVATIVPICGILLIFFCMYLGRRQKRLSSTVQANQAESKYMIRALVHDEVSTAGSSEMAGAADLAIAAEDTRKAGQDVEDTQARLLAKIANATGGMTPGDRLTAAGEEALGAAGVLHKLNKILNHTVKSTDSASFAADTEAWNEVMQSSKVFTPAEAEKLNKLREDVLKLRNDKIQALEEATAAEANMTQLTTVTHADALSSLLAKQATQATSEEAQEVLNVENELGELANKESSGKAVLLQAWDESVAQAASDEEKAMLLTMSKEAFVKFDLEAKAERNALKEKLQAAAALRAQKRKEQDSAQVASLLKSHSSEVDAVLKDIAALNKKASDASAAAVRAIDDVLVDGSLASAALLRSAESTLSMKTAELKKQMQTAASRAATAEEKDQLLKNQESSIRRLEEAEQRERQAVKVALKERLNARKAAVTTAREARIQAEAKLLQAEAQAASSDATSRKAENQALAELAIDKSSGYATHAVTSALNATIALTELDAATASKIAELRIAGKTEEIAAILASLPASKAAVVADSERLSEDRLNNVQVELSEKEASIKSQLRVNKEDALRQAQRTIAEAQQAVRSAAEDESTASAAVVEDVATVVADAVLATVDSAATSNSASDDIRRQVVKQKLDIGLATQALTSQDAATEKSLDAEKAQRLVLRREQTTLAEEVVAENLEAQAKAAMAANNQLAAAAKQRIKDLSTASDPQDRKQILETWQENVSAAEEKLAQDSAREREQIQAKAAARKKRLEAKKAEEKKPSSKGSAALKFQRALGSLKREEPKANEAHEREMAELKKKHEEQEAQLRLTMQAELEKLEAELRRNVQQKKADEFQQAVLREKHVSQEMSELKEDLEQRAKDVDRAIVEEKEIQAALMQKKIQSRQQRLMKVQKAQASSNRREEIMARLDFERKQLDNITDVNELVAALARVNELQAQLGALAN